jgi:hypothetical protein
LATQRHDLLVLGIRGAFGKWLQKLPAAQRAEPPDVGSLMRNVAAVAFAEHFPLHMGWSQLAALNDGFAIGADQPLRDVEATDAGFRETEHPQ